jgi:uncharacterized membrane protein (UPF0127 family)
MDDYNTLKTMAIMIEMVFIDLKSRFLSSHTSVPQRKEMAYYEFRQKYFCATHGISPDI